MPEQGFNLLEWWITQHNPDGHPIEKMLKFVTTNHTLTNDTKVLKHLQKCIKVANLFCHAYGKKLVQCILNLCCLNHCESNASQS